MIYNFCLLHPGGTNVSFLFHTIVKSPVRKKMAAAGYFPFKYGQDEARQETGVN